MTVTAKAYDGFGCIYGRANMYSTSSTFYWSGTTSDCPGYTYDIMVSRAIVEFGYNPQTDTFIYNGVIMNIPCPIPTCNLEVI